MSDRNYFLAASNPGRYNRVLDAAQHPTLLDLPEMQEGNYAIRHMIVPADTHIDMFTGGFVRFKEDIVIRQLFHKNTLWMSDSPAEMSAMRDLVMMSSPGHVLVAGLGMGLVAKMLAEEEGINQVTVIEIAPEIVNMISPYMPDNVTVITADFREWVKTADTSIYSSVILDIWGDISTDDLPDMLNLWEQTGLESGGIWGIEALFYQLLDDMRDLDTCEELVDALHKRQLSKIAQYVENIQKSVEEFYQEFYPDSDRDSDFDYVLTEAFARVYGCIRV